MNHVYKNGIHLCSIEVALLDNKFSSQKIWILHSIFLMTYQKVRKTKSGTLILKCDELFYQSILNFNNRF